MIFRSPLIAWMALCLAFVITGQSAWGQVDTTRPIFSDFSFTPNSVDVTSASQTVTATVRLTDDLSGVNNAVARFRSPSNKSLIVSLGRALEADVINEKSYF